MKSQGNNGFFERRKTKDERRKTNTSYLLSFISLSLYLFIFSTPACLSQETPVSLTYKSSLLGYGTSSVFDSYLSPLKYTGKNVALYYEQMKHTGLMNGNIAAQHLLNANYSWSKNSTGTASHYAGIFEYNYGLFYRIQPTEQLQFFTGMQAGGLLGFVYNTRNGNNPATGKAHLDLSPSGIVNYRLQIKKQFIDLKYQIGFPLIGAMYSPQFGQSYYEIGLGKNDNLIHFASFHNYLSPRSMFSVEIPFNSLTLQLAYRFFLYETRINDLDTQLITNTFYVGLSHHFFVVKGKNKNNNYRYLY